MGGPPQPRGQARCAGVFPDGDLRVGREERVPLARSAWRDARPPGENKS